VVGSISGVISVAVAGIEMGENSWPMALVVKDPDAEITEEDIVKVVNGKKTIS